MELENCEEGSNTDSGSKRGVYCRDTTILYLAFLLDFIKINK